MPDPKNKMVAACMEWAERTLHSIAAAVESPEEERTLTSTLELALEDLRAKLTEISAE